MIQPTTSQQYGHRRLDFAIPNSAGGFLILPATPARGNPWLWYAPSFIQTPYPLPKPLHAWYMTRLLDAGIAIGGVDVGESWGSPAGRAIFTQFHELAVREFGLDAKACLLGQSRGGLMQYNWAVEHPESVRCIGGIYPVCDVLFPGRIETISKAYGLTPQQLTEQSAMHNPLERLSALAAARVPIFHIHGDSDEVVPLESNSAELARRFGKLGGTTTVRIIPGIGHKEAPEFFECVELLEFFLKTATQK